MSKADRPQMTIQEALWSCATDEEKSQWETVGTYYNREPPGFEAEHNRARRMHDQLDKRLVDRLRKGAYVADGVLAGDELSGKRTEISRAAWRTFEFDYDENDVGNENYVLEDVRIIDVTDNADGHKPARKEVEFSSKLLRIDDEVFAINGDRQALLLTALVEAHNAGKGVATKDLLGKAGCQFGHFPKAFAGYPHWDRLSMHLSWTGGECRFTDRAV